MYPVNSCSPIRLKTEAPIAQLLGLKEYKRRVAKNNYVHYWFSRLVHIFLAMQCKEDFFKMAFLMQSVLQKMGKNQQKSELITGDTNWKHLPKSSQTFCWSKYSVDPSNFPKGILTQHGTGYKSLREQYFWSLSGEKKCLHYPFKASWNLKPQDPNRKHSQTFFFSFFVCMLPMCGTPHIQRMQSSMQPCLSIADKWLENWKTCVLHQRVKQAPVWSVSRKTGFLGNRYYWKVVHSNTLKIYKHISW